MSESPSTWKYVGVWLLAGFLGNIASVVLSSIAYSNVRSLDDAINAMMLGIPLEAMVFGVCFVAVYSVFSSLNMSVVFPWMVGLISLGVLMNLARLASSGFAPGWVYIYQIACTATMLFGIRAFFKAKGRIT